MARIVAPISSTEVWSDKTDVHPETRTLTEFSFLAPREIDCKLEGPIKNIVQGVLKSSPCLRIIKTNVIFYRGATVSDSAQSEVASQHRQ